jgi:hypothetical protein
MLRRIDALPANIKPATAKNGKYVVAHSETGHDHVIESRPNVRLYDSQDPFVSYLEVIEATDAMECLLEHMRSYDTHETIKVPPGIYEVRRQREYTPEGWRKAQD